MIAQCWTTSTSLCVPAPSKKCPFSTHTSTMESFTIASHLYTRQRLLPPRSKLPLKRLTLHHSSVWRLNLLEQSPTLLLMQNWYFEISPSMMNIVEESSCTAYELIFRRKACLQAVKCFKLDGVTPAQDDVSTTMTNRSNVGEKKVIWRWTQTMQGQF